MDEQANNPPANRLMAGVSEQDLAQAIDASGYPLQNVVSRMLRQDFLVQPEWGYRDENASALRALDLFAQRQLYKDEEMNAFRVRPTLELLIECKRSELPYVFFRDELTVRPEFPIVAGLGSRGVVAITDDDRSTWHLGPLDVLGLDRDPFIFDAPVAATFSKAARKGDKLELSGSDPYNRLVLPLTRALRHRQEQLNRDPKWYGDLSLLLAIAVLDAPIVEVDATGSHASCSLTPWIRLLRHETEDEVTGTRSVGLVALDVVHKDYLQRYLRDAVLPFALRFAALAQQHHVELASGKAYAAGLGADSWTELESRLLPLTTSVPIPIEHPRGVLPWLRALGNQLMQYLQQRSQLRRLRR